jgi:hypothetical protein
MRKGISRTAPRYPVVIIHRVIWFDHTLAFAIVADGFDWTSLHGFLAKCLLLRGDRLLKHIGVAAVVAAPEISGCGFPAQVAVNALVIAVKLSGHVFRVFIRNVGHRFSFVLCRWKIHGAASAAADSKRPGSWRPEVWKIISSDSSAPEPNHRGNKKGVWGESGLDFESMVERSQAVVARMPPADLTTGSACCSGRFSALEDQRAEILPVQRPPTLVVGARCMMQLMQISMFPFLFPLSILDQLPLSRRLPKCPENFFGNVSFRIHALDWPVNLVGHPKDS